MHHCSINTDYTHGIIFSVPRFWILGCQLVKIFEASSINNNLYKNYLTCTNSNDFEMTTKGNQIKLQKIYS